MAVCASRQTFLSSRIHPFPQAKVAPTCALQFRSIHRDSLDCADPSNPRILLQDAKKRVKDCCVPAESDLRWKQMFAEELDVIAHKMSDYEMERQVGHLIYQASRCISISKACAFLLGQQAWAIWTGPGPAQVLWSFRHSVAKASS